MFDVWGSAEVCTPPQLESDPDDYQYCCFDTEAGGCVFRERDDLEYFGDDGARLELYELVVTRTPRSAPYLGYWACLGEGPRAPAAAPYPEYPTQEVWTPHPDPAKAPYTWRFVGRVPDLVVDAGEFALAFERALGKHGMVQHALAVGRAGERPAVLVELADGYTPEAAAGGLWRDVVAPANEDVPEASRVAESHLVLVAAGEFVRSSEGHMLRTQTLQKFQGRIDAVYGRAPSEASVSARPRYQSIIETVEVSHVVEGED